AGRTVILFNTTDDPNNPVELARTTTDAKGFYRFDNFDELLVGKYRVQEVVPAGWRGTTPTSVDFAVTRGDVNKTVNFGNKRTFSSVSALSASSPVFLAPDSTSAGTPTASTQADLPIANDPAAPADATQASTTPAPADMADSKLILDPPTRASWDLFGLSFDL